MNYWGRCFLIVKQLFFNELQQYFSFSQENKKCFQESHTDQENELRIIKREDEMNLECKEDEKSKELQNQNTNLETEEREKTK